MKARYIVHNPAKGQWLVIDTTTGAQVYEYRTHESGSSPGRSSESGRYERNDMGLIVWVYKNPQFKVCSTGGITQDHAELTLVNVPGPFGPSEKRPAAMLMAGPRDTVNIVPAVNVGTEDKPIWEPLRKDGHVGPMAGGAYAGASDGRFSEAVEKILGHGFYGLVAVHDRFETAEHYATYD